MDGQSYLLLIRDEGGPPELQVGDLYLLQSFPTLSWGGTYPAASWNLFEENMRTVRPEEGLPL